MLTSPSLFFGVVTIGTISPFLVPILSLFYQTGPFFAKIVGWTRKIIPAMAHWQLMPFVWSTNRNWLFEPWTSIYIDTFLKSQRWSLFDLVMVPKRSLFWNNLVPIGTIFLYGIKLSTIINIILPRGFKTENTYYPQKESYIHYFVMRIQSNPTYPTW